MKNIIIILFLFLSQPAFSQDIDWIHFMWQNGNISGKHFDKVAIFIPVAIDNMHHKFVMQFDLGADHTVIYENPVKPYFHRKDNLESKRDTSLSFFWNNTKNYTFRNVGLKLDKVSFGNRNIGCLKDYGQKRRRVSLLAFFAKMAGTIGTDIFQDKILIIDYPNKRICAVNELPGNYSAASFIPFKIKYGHIILTFTIGGKEEDVLFDTGSSIFELATTEKNALPISDNEVIDSIEAPSWGKTIKMYGRKTNAEIKLGQKTLIPATVYYDTINKTGKMDEALNTWGITGNSYFLNNVVIIDWKNKRFGVL
jgi:hypothetical protein